MGQHAGNSKNFEQIPEYFFKKACVNSQLGVWFNLRDDVLSLHFSLLPLRERVVFPQGFFYGKFTAAK